MSKKEKLIPKKSPCGRHSPFDGSWWEFDGRGIALARVCQHCCGAVLATFRKEILTPYTATDVDEPIEVDDDHAA